MIDWLFSECPALLHAAMIAAAPLIWAGMGGAFSERSGVMNIGLEGMMLTGAFAGVAGSWYTGNPWVGLVCGAGCGGMMGLFHAWLCLYGRTDQIIAGMGINLFALGATGFLMGRLFHTRGNSPQVAGLPHVQGISGIPFLSDLLFPFSGLHVVLAAAIVLTYFILYRSVFGLRLRACGENPWVVKSSGIRVGLYRYLAVGMSGVLAGIGGVQLSLGEISQFSVGMTGGRGFIALAALICSGWSPLRLIWICLFFGLSEALGERLQAVFPMFSARIYLALPFVLALMVLAIKPNAVEAPEALGKS